MAASIFPYDTLHRFARQVFASMDCSPAHAHTAATNLLAADLAGVDSHGVARLSGYYRLYKAGRMRGDATYAITHQTPGTATFSAGGGLGLVAAELAMQIAMDKATATQPVPTALALSIAICMASSAATSPRPPPAEKVAVPGVWCVIV